MKEILEDSEVTLLARDHSVLEPDLLDFPILLCLLISFTSQ